MLHCCFAAVKQKEKTQLRPAHLWLTWKDVSQSPFLTFSPFLIFYRWCEYSILSQENSHGFHLKCFPKCQLKDTFFTLKLWSTPTQPIPYGFRSARYGDQVICSAAFIEPKCVFLLILLSSSCCEHEQDVMTWYLCLFIKCVIRLICLRSIFSIYLFASVQLLRPQSQWYVIWSWYLRRKHWCAF